MGTDPNNLAENDSHRIDKMLAEYERAQEIGHHIDTVIHEITAIVWGANTLLLGFILEVKCDSSNQKLVVVAAGVGIFMSFYVIWVMCARNGAKNIAYEICCRIEIELPLTNRLTNRIDDEYPKWSPGQTGVWIITIVFVVAWVLVICHASSCLFSCR